MQSLCKKNVCLTPSSPQFLAILENHPSSSAWGILCQHMLCSHLLLSLKQRGCNTIWVCPPSTLVDFSLLLVVTSAQFPLEVCTAVTPRGKENRQGSNTPYFYLSSSLQLTAPSHLPLKLHPLLETQRLSRVPQPASIPNHREEA